MDAALLPLPALWADLDKDIQTRTTTPALPTGIAPLDLLTWGLWRQEVLVIGARPSHGKSSLAMFMAFHLAQAGHRVLFLSLEMTKHSLLERMFCHVCDVNGFDLRRGIRPPDYAEKQATFRAMIEHLPLFILDDCGYQFEEIQHLFKTFPTAKPDVVFLDYIQLVAVAPGATRRDGLTEYLRGIKELVKREKLAFVCLSQLNRHTEDAKPTLRDLKETGALEEVADAVLLLNWKGRTADPPTSEYIIEAAKQRSGPTASIAVNFHPEHYRFTEQPETTWPPTPATPPPVGIERGVGDA